MRRAPVLQRTAAAFAANAQIAGIAVCVNERDREAVRAMLAPLQNVLLTEGGETRTASVRNALEALAALPCPPDYVLIHDGARPFVTQKIIDDCISTVRQFGSAVCALPCTDTAVRAESGFIRETVPREGLWRMQTPQAFRLFDILDAYDRAEGPATDDATLFLRAGHALSLVEGGADNFKRTTPADWARAERLLARCGTGFDTHRLVEGRRLVLGGVTVPFARGLLGHSDADVLAHAVMDALLGAAALPDIGQLFPDTDPAYAGADSMALLRQVVARVAEKGLRVNQLDATVIAERPKLAPYVPAMRENLAAACGVAPGQVGLKATTTEGMNDEGRGLCISAQAVATLL